MVTAHTPEQIRSAITHLPTLSIEQLTHNYKCALSRDPKLYKPFIDAIERELRKRRHHVKEDITDEHTSDS